MEVLFNSSDWAAAAGKRENVVFESVRNVAEIETLIKHSTANKLRFYLLSVDAPVELRYERVRQRNHAETDGKELTLDLFKQQEEKEMNGSSSQNLKRVMDSAHFRIANEKNLAHCKRQVDEIMQKIL